jgi:hypothetical protein
MLLVLHIAAALSGIGLSTYALVRPSLLKIRISYFAVMITVLSGTIIIIKDHLGILSVCLSGLLYVGSTIGALTLANRRLAKQSAKISSHR